MTVRVARSGVIDAPAAEVWRLLRDFNSHAAWHPATASSAIEAGEPADLVGAVRAFRLTDGGFLREQLIALSDREMSLTYCLLEAPLRLDGYVATMRLRTVTDGDRSFLDWQSHFETPAAERAALARLVGEGIYAAGIAALQARFRPGDARPTRVPPARVEPRPPTLVGSGLLPMTGDILAGTAILVERHGGPEVLVLRQVEVPPPGPGEVRLRQAAVGVNMIDLHGRAGDFGLDRLPAIPGMEGAGTIVDIGPGETAFRAGDRVVYAGAPPGAYASLRTMPSAMLVPLPPDIETETAAAAFLKGITADLLLHDVHRVQAGETVLVHAAAGGLGLLLCGWARALGATVIGSVSTTAKAEAAARAGCSHVVVGGATLAADVMERTDGRGVDVVFDGIGRTGFEASVAALARRGHLVSYGQVSGPVGVRDIDGLAAKSLRLSRPNFAHYTATGEEVRHRAERLFDALRRGLVRPLIDQRLPLAEAAQAHRRLASRQSIGSIILLP